MSSNIHNLQNKAADEKYSKLISSINDDLAAHLNKLLTELFKSADDTFFSAADQNNASTLFNFMREIKLHQQAIVDRAVLQMRRRLQPVFEDEKFDLINKNAIDTLADLSGEIEKADDEFRGQITQLKQRLDHMTTTGSRNFDKNALNPRAFYSTILSALTPLKLDKPTLKMFMQVFSKQFISQFGELYDVINYHFLQANVLPDLSLNIRQSYDKRNPTLGEQVEIAEPATYSFAGTDNQEHYFAEDMLQKPANDGFKTHEVIDRLTTESLPATHAIEKKNTNNFYPQKVLVEALSRLQTRYKTSNNMPLDFRHIETLISQLLGNFPALAEKSISPQHKKLIELTSLFIIKMLDNTAATEVISPLILKLQIPLTKLSILEKDFFNNNKHPARLLLNALPKTTVGINSTNDRMYSNIEVIIDTLLNEYKQNSVSFLRAYTSLNKLVQQESDSHRKKEQAEQKQVLHKHAKKVVVGELKKLTQNKTIPEYNRELILKLWPSYMLQQYMQHGKTSKQWEQAVQSLFQLINFIQKPANLRDLQLLVNTQDDLIKSVLSHLQTLNLHKDTLQSAIDNLQARFIYLIQTTDIVDPEQQTEDIFSMTVPDWYQDPQSEPALFDTTEQLIQPEDDNIADKRRQLNSLPTEVKPGAWFDVFIAEDKPTEQLKLSIIVLEEAKLIFVNRQGINVLEKDAIDFAEELEHDQSRIILNSSIFENALDKLVTSLGDTQAV